MSSNQESYKTIIHDQKLFWDLYCSFQRKQENPYVLDQQYYFEYVLENNTFKALGLDGSLRKIIEFVRLQFLQYLDHNKNNLNFQYFANEINVPELELLCQLNSHDQDKSVKGFFFREYVLPLLSPLLKSLGFDCSIQLSESTMFSYYYITFLGKPENNTNMTL